MTDAEIYTLITATAAVIAAAFSAAAAIYQCYFNKLHQDASVMPYIVDFVSLGSHDNRDLNFSISNKGLGPAIIESFEYRWNGKILKYHELTEFFFSQIGDRFVLYVAELGKGSALRVNEDMNIIKITRISSGKYTEDDKLVIDTFIEQASKNLKLHINYKSVISDVTHKYRTEALISLLER